MYCKYCGEQVPDDSKFCENCGKDLSRMKGKESKEKNNQREKFYQSNNKNKKILIFSIVLSVILVAIIVPSVVFSRGCSHSSSYDNEKLHSEEVKENAVEETTETEMNEEFIDFADIAAEELLLSIDNRDFNTFSKDLENEMIEDMPKEEFLKFADQLVEAVGNYIEDSKNFKNIERDKGNITVVYDTQYSDEPAGVELRIVLKKMDDGIKIVGIWLNSPKIRSE